MWWFFLSGIAVVGACLMVDHLAKIQLYRSLRYYCFQLFIAVLTIVFDIVARERVWVISPQHTLGVSILGTPFELILFGFAMIYLAVLAYELLAKHAAQP